MGRLTSVEVYPKVMEDFRNRREMGIAKYHRPLGTHNGRSALQDAYEESIDETMYLKQRLLEEDDYRRVNSILTGALLFYAEGNQDGGEQAKMALQQVYEDEDETES